MTTHPHPSGRGGWIRQYHRRHTGGPTLVCFPHAGGSAAAYFALSHALSATAEVLVVQYPGRQDRIAEDPVDDIRRLAHATADALEPWRDRPLALFGHSMGSLVAYETGLTLQQRTPYAPIGLLASGRAAPSVRQDRGVHLREDDGIVAELAELAGTDRAVLADKELLAAVLPAVRSDFKAVETYQGAPDARLRCPITAYGGAADPHVTESGLRKWSGHTASGFALRRFPGGHFYLQERPGDLAAAITEDLALFGAPTPARSC